MFTGFTDATVDFMWGIRFNNERSWFEPRKEIYQKEFYYPMRDLAGELYDHIAPQRPDDGLRCKVSRIYRDARRLHGRGPYRDHLWLSIEPARDDGLAHPGFWFELGPEGWSYGCGYWNIRPAAMAKLRSRITREPEEMEKLTRKLARQTEFRVEGEVYKRPKGEAPSELLAPWFLLKNVSIGHEEKLTEELFSRDIVEHLKRGYDFLLPYYDYFAMVESEPEPDRL